MPKLWTSTIADHRDAVRDALLDATGALVHDTGLAGLTMAAVAERAGVGRATLYRYFPDLDGLLVAWHERHLGRHIEALVAAWEAEPDPALRLRALIEAMVNVARESAGHGDTAMSAMLHRAPHATEAGKRLRAIVRAAIDEAARAGAVRADVPPEELADFVFSSLGSAGGLSRPAINRLIGVVLSGLRPPAEPSGG